MNMANKNQKQYPHTVKLKSQLKLLVIGAMGIVVSIIVYNVYQSVHQIKTNAVKENTQVKRLATATDVKWYQQAQMQKPVIVKSTHAQVINENNSIHPENNITPALSEDLQKAMAAPITSNQITGEQVPQATQLTVNHSSSDVGLSNEVPASQTEDQNQQAAKKVFLQTHKIKSEDNYLQQSLQNPRSRYEIKAGTIIPSILISGINSDLPGQITAQVRSSVYDTVSGKHLLIPQGTKLIGVYDSQVAYGQARVLVAWKRIILPNGKSLDLEGMPGVDVSGYAGFNDQVNNHYQKIFSSVLLMSVLGAGAQLSQPQVSSNNNGQLSVGQIIAQSMGTNIANTGNMILQKNINVQPTLEIRPGYEFNITVTKDMVFPEAYESTDLKSQSFQDNWATSSKVKQVLMQAAQQGKLAYVLKKSEEMQLPASVALIPLVESHCQNITSPKGAAGDWQLMPAVANDYGITSEERFEFKPATNTALKLLQNLHARFGNWELAFAAYNAGSTRVETALKKQPTVSSIQELALPIETKQYVQKIKTANAVLITV